MRRIVLALLAVASVTAQAQTVSRTGEARLKIQAVSGVRATHPVAASSTTPEWHGLIAGTAVDDAQPLIQSVAYSLNLNQRCTNEADSALTITVQTGTLPTGLSLTAGIVSGTPTTVQTLSVTFRCTDGTTPVDQEFDFTVAAPDVTAPAAPVSVTLLSRTSTNAFLQSAPCTDPSGILSYKWWRCDTAGCGTPSLRDTTADVLFTGQPGASTRYYSTSCVDNAANESSRSPEVTVLPYDSGSGVPLVVNGNFETGTISPFPNYSGNTPTVQTTIKRTGTYGMKSILNRLTSPTNYRTEITTSYNAGQTATMGQTSCYGFSVYLPSPYPSDSISEFVSQWHGKPDAGEADQPPALGLQTKDGRWRLYIAWNTGQPTIASEQQATSATLGTYSTNVWTDWVFIVKWSYTSTGELYVYQNGTLVYSRIGQPIGFNDTVGPYFKMGIYKSGWKTTASAFGDERTLYHDEYKQAAQGCTYATVAP